MKKLKEALAVLGLIVGGIIALFWYKNNQDEKTLAENTKVKEKLAEKDKELAVNDAALKNEEATRNQLKSDMEAAKNEKITSDNVVDFFNKRS